MHIIEQLTVKIKHLKNLGFREFISYFNLKIVDSIFLFGRSYNNYICKRNFKELNNYTTEIENRCLVNEFSFYKFEYKDENWNYAKKIYPLSFLRRIGIKKKVLDNICVNNKVTINAGDNILIKSFNLSGDWVYLVYNNNLSNNYCLSFSTTIYSIFTEFQIAFKHKSILERLRFMVVNNEKAVFEVVNNGYFSRAIVEKPFSFVLGKKYYIEVFVDQNTYSLVIDHIEIITILDKENKIKSGGLALIFWDSKKSSAAKKGSTINLTIEEMKLELI
jgi:hypothetical protein